MPKSYVNAYIIKTAFRSNGFILIFFITKFVQFKLAVVFTHSNASGAFWLHPFADLVMSSSANSFYSTVRLNKIYNLQCRHASFCGRLRRMNQSQFSAKVRRKTSLDFRKLACIWCIWVTFLLSRNELGASKALKASDCLMCYGWSCGLGCATVAFSYYII